MLTTWHARAIAALIAVAALLGAYGAGRETAPAKVVTRDVVRVEVLWASYGAGEAVTTWLP